MGMFHVCFMDTLYYRFYFWWGCSLSVSWIHYITGFTFGEDVLCLFHGYIILQVLLLVVMFSVCFMDTLYYRFYFWWGCSTSVSWIHYFWWGCSTSVSWIHYITGFTFGGDVLCLFHGYIILQVLFLLGMFSVCFMDKLYYRFYFWRGCSPSFSSIHYITGFTFGGDVLRLFNVYNILQVLLLVGMFSVCFMDTWMNV